MSRSVFAATVALLLLTDSAHSGPAFCPTTLPTRVYVPPAPYPQSQSADGFWYGSDELRMQLPWNGVWHTNGNVDTHGGLRTKLVFWHRGFDWRKEREPDISFTATRLDAEAPAITIQGASPVFISTAWPAMMIGVDVPTVGCWEFTARYHAHVLRFVVSVEP